MTRLLCSAAMALALTGGAASAQDLSEADIKALALEAIRENPGIIVEALEALEAERIAAEAAMAGETLEAERALLENDPNAPVLGNPDGDVTIVEFFDYNCPYCRRVKPEMQALLAEDAGVRVVYREWPILGEGSVFAARAALAAREQGKYEDLHWALMGLEGRADEDRVIEAARGVGLDIDRLRADMEAPAVEEHIATSMRLTRALGFNGTPSFVIGGALLPGFVEADVLAEAVAEARAASE